MEKRFVQIFALATSLLLTGGTLMLLTAQTQSYSPAAVTPNADGRSVTLLPQVDVRPSADFDELPTIVVRAAPLDPAVATDAAATSAVSGGAATRASIRPLPRMPYYSFGKTRSSAGRG